MQDRKWQSERDHVLSFIKQHLSAGLYQQVKKELVSRQGVVNKQLKLRRKLERQPPSGGWVWD